MKNIPVEVVELIIDLLYHDKDLDFSALKSCSLTCRTWMTRARYWIFQKVKLSFSTEDDLVECNKSLVPFGVIQKLTVKGHRPKLRVLAAELWSKCTSVKDLALEEFDSDLQDLSVTLVTFLASFPQLQSLKLEQCLLSSLDILFYAIRALPELRYLTVDGLSWETLEDSRDLYPAGRMTESPLRHLHLSFLDDSEEFSRLLIKMEPRLHLWSVWTDDEIADLLIMESCAPTMKMIDLTFREVDVSDLSRYTSLQVVMFATKISPRILNTIQSKYLRYVVLYCDTDSTGVLSARSQSKYRWDLIEAGMASLQYMPEIVVYIGGFVPTANSPPGQHIFELLPESYRRGSILLAERTGEHWTEMQELLD